MSQYDFGNLESPLTGTALINTHLEPWRNALHSSHSGSSRPSYAQAGMLWINNASNPWIVNVFDGTDDVPVGQIDITTNIFTLTGPIKAPDTAGLPIYNSAGTLIGTLGASSSQNVSFEGQMEVKGLLKPTSHVAFPDKGEVTISAGSITVTGTSHTVDTEADAAADDLDTIIGGSDGQILYLRLANAARVVTIKHNTGNINIVGGQDLVLDSAAKQIMLIYDTELSDWLLVSGGDVATPPVLELVTTQTISSNVSEIAFEGLLDETDAIYEVFFEDMSTQSGTNAISFRFKDGSSNISGFNYDYQALSTGTALTGSNTNEVGFFNISGAFHGHLVIMGMNPISNDRRSTVSYKWFAGGNVYTGYGHYDANSDADGFVLRGNMDEGRISVYKRSFT